MKEYQLTARAQALRNRMVEQPAVCTERAVYLTESWQNTEGVPAPLRRARALRNVLEHMTIRIEPGELLVGNHTSKIRGGALMPELSSDWILAEMDSLSTREYDPYQDLNETEKEAMRRCVAYWSGRSLRSQMEQLVPPELQGYDHVAVSSFGFCENGHYPAHVAIDYALLLREGLSGMAERIRARMARLTYSDPADLRRRPMLQAMLESYEAVECFAARYAALAEEQARTAPQPRQAELEEIARICRKVPHAPADSFREALQSCWFLYVCLMLEGWGAGMSMGRMDQYLAPYYERDIAAGVLTDDEARELLSLMMIKMNAVINPQDGIVATMMTGSPCMQGITIGGCTRAGEDAVNAVSYLILDAERAVGLTGEDVVVRIHPKNPPKFVRRACQVARELGGKLKFVSDTQTIRSLVWTGIDEADANEYISTGCHNPTIPAKTHDIGGSSFNYPLILELTLNHGRVRATGAQLGLDLGDPAQFERFEDLLDAFERQFEYVMERLFYFKNVDLMLYQQYPCPLLSSFYEGCIEHGDDLYDYRVRTTHTSAFAGAPNVGDSLAAIKKAIYDDRSLSWPRLLELLDHDLEGDPQALALLRRVPKFGNNDPYVDDLFRDVLARSCDFLHSHTAYAGVATTAACLAMTINVAFGHITGALPDGRKAGVPLAEGGISPYQGRNTSGVSSTLASVAALDQTRLSHGSILNLRISKKAVESERNLEKLADALRIFCETGGDLVQFNFVVTNTLRDAQQHPDRYRDLLVRVATYSAYFVELSRELQDDIIARFEFSDIG